MSSPANDATETRNDLDNSAPLWKYVKKLGKPKKTGGNIPIECNLCQKNFSGTYSRVKAHLLRIGGQGIKPCEKATEQILVEMQKLIEECELNVKRAAGREVPLPPGSSSQAFGSSADHDLGLDYHTQGEIQLASKKRKPAGGPLERAFKHDLREQCDSEIARMFYTGGLPFNLARNPYYRNSYSLASQIPGYVPPGYNLLRTTLLQKERNNVERLLQPTKHTWKQKGVSICSDGWTDSQRRPLINFMAACESGPMFLKAVNCEGEYMDKHHIANLILGVIKEVGHENVVQIVTDNAPVCKAAGKLVEQQYPRIFWTPCVVHTLNLALKGICNPKEKDNCYDECKWIKLITDDAWFIKNFILNHSMRLSMFQEHCHLKLLAIAETRFASAIVSLKRLREVKHGLQQMVISPNWSMYEEDDIGKAAFVKEKILSEIFWEDIDYILCFTNPVYEMLRLADTDKPCLHLVYEWWDTMIEEVKKAIFRKECKQLSHDHSEFWDAVHLVLVERWTKSYSSLHCLAHSLNPKYYSAQWLEENVNRVAPHRDAEVTKEQKLCIERYMSDDVLRRKLNVEFASFSMCRDDFGSHDSINDRYHLPPVTWWAIHGSSSPTLQSIALKLLGQPCSSSCCERNWSTYNFIHSLTRNKITPQRAEDLVFVHTNLRLLARESPSYRKGLSQMWDIAGDGFDSMDADGVGRLEMASLSLDEPVLEATLFDVDGDHVSEGEGRDDQ